MNPCSHDWDYPITAKFSTDPKLSIPFCRQNGSNLFNRTNTAYQIKDSTNEFLETLGLCSDLFLPPTLSFWFFLRALFSNFCFRSSFFSFRHSSQFWLWGNLPPHQTNILGTTLNCIWWWGSCPEYDTKLHLMVRLLELYGIWTISFIAIIPRSTPTESCSIC